TDSSSGYVVVKVQTKSGSGIFLADGLEPLFLLVVADLVEPKGKISTLRIGQQFIFRNPMRTSLSELLAAQFPSLDE
ncbi:MAG TPA: hypothetical protein VFQ05_04210, partial [Candidatus Eisenbacteria bacterium]|nr:hypothetical protein [Candidatus Eisenbacteria bacterium]